MIKIENVVLPSPDQWESLINGCRNPLNSWDKYDSHQDDKDFVLGEKDLSLMNRLSKAGTDHRKFMRMITVYMDITAPVYWWAEFDTYKVGTVRNSCSFMHKGLSKEFTINDFSLKDELIYKILDPSNKRVEFKFTKKLGSECLLWERIIDQLNYLRSLYLETEDEQVFQTIRCILPSGYMQKSTVMLNYEVLANMYKSRKNHKLDEWRDFCKWIDTLPYSELITGEREVV